MRLLTAARLLTLAAASMMPPAVARAGIATTSPELVAAAPALTSPQIVGVLSAAAKADAASAALAVDSAHNIRIQGYADDVLRDSTRLQKELAAFTAASRVTAEDSAASQALGRQAARDLADLTGSYGEVFEHRYLAQQIVSQGDVLALIDQQLAVAGRDGTLVTLLTNARTSVARHLIFAQQLRGDIER